MSVTEAARSSRLEALIATRDALAQAIDSGGGTIAQNVAQFRAVLADIEEIQKADVGQKGTALDELARRRQGQAPSPSGPTKRHK